MVAVLLVALAVVVAVVDSAAVVAVVDSAVVVAVVVSAAVVAVVAVEDSKGIFANHTHVSIKSGPMSVELLLEQHYERCLCCTFQVWPQSA